MIYTLTPNPALDISGTADKIVPNEKTYVYNETRHPGGNAINAARIIATLGVPVTATGFLGGSIGYEIRQLLDAEGIRERFVKVNGQTRINLTVFENQSHSQTRFSFPGPAITVREFRALFSLMSQLQDGDLLVVGGSLPPGLSVKHLAKIVWLCKRHRIPCFVDSPAGVLKHIIREGPVFIKPNLLEFQELIDKKPRTIDSVVKEAQALTPQVPLICVSSVEGGAVLVTPSGAWFAKGPQVKARTSVGAGDSMVGGMAAHFWRRKLHTGTDTDAQLAREAPLMLRWGLAAALASITAENTVLGKAREIKAFFKKIKVEAV